MRAKQLVAAAAMPNGWLFVEKGAFNIGIRFFKWWMVKETYGKSQNCTLVLEIFFVAIVLFAQIKIQQNNINNNSL